MSEKEVIVSTKVVTGTLFLNSKPFYVLFDSYAYLFVYIHPNCIVIEFGKR